MRKFSRGGRRSRRLSRNSRKYGVQKRTQRRTRSSRKTRKRGKTPIRGKTKTSIRGKRWVKRKTRTKKRGGSKPIKGEDVIIGDVEDAHGIPTYEEAHGKNTDKRKMEGQRWERIHREERERPRHRL